MARRPPRRPTGALRHGGERFDGHDAAINIMRRLLRNPGRRGLRPHRSVGDRHPAIQEDAQGVAVSSYQGGHVEYFSYLVERLRERGAGHVKVYGGGGGVIVPAEIELLRERGVHIFSPQDGQRLGLPGMINELIAECDTDLSTEPAPLEALLSGEERALARVITTLEAGNLAEDDLSGMREAAGRSTTPVLGITGTGGSGKSSLTDELVRRLPRQ